MQKKTILMVVGDDNQSIYSFKNAQPDGIRLFTDSHPGCVDIDFQECRRCPKKIVHIADVLIGNDPSHTQERNGILVPYDSNKDGEVAVIQWRTLEEEISGIAEIVQKILEKNSSSLIYEDILILSPRRKIAQSINEKLLELNIPSHLVANNYDSLFEDDTAKDTFAFISYLANNEDYVSLRYLLHNRDYWYSKTYMKIVEYAIEHNETIVEVLRKIESGESIISRVTANSPIIQRFSVIAQRREQFDNIDSIDEFKKQLNDLFGEGAINLKQRVYAICDEFVYDATDPSPMITQLSIEIKNKISDLVITGEEVLDGGKVRVMTCFSAKGLKGKVVVIGSCVDGLIPSLGDDDDFDEQRRLFYVAITRCEYTEDEFEGLLIISSFVNISEGKKKSLKINVDYPGVQASCFINEIRRGDMLRTVRGDQYLDQL